MKKKSFNKLFFPLTNRVVKKLYELFWLAFLPAHQYNGSEINAWCSLQQLHKWASRETSHPEIVFLWESSSTELCSVYFHSQIVKQCRHIWYEYLKHLEKKYLSGDLCTWNGSKWIPWWDYKKTKQNKNAFLCFVFIIFIILFYICLISFLKLIFHFSYPCI